MSLRHPSRVSDARAQTKVANRSGPSVCGHPWLEPLEGRVFLATHIWDGGGSDNNWATAANWDDDVAPASGDTLIFPASAPADSLATLNNFPADTAFASIELRGDDSYTIDGNRVALGAGGLIVSSPAGAHTLNAPLLLNGLGVPVTIADGATLTINGVLSGNAPLNKAGFGTLVLTADNNGTEPYTGFVNVNDGVLEVSHPEALGDTVGETNVVDFATLQLNTGAGGGAEVIRSGGTLVANATLAWNGLVESFGTEIQVNGAGTTLTLNEDLVGDAIVKSGAGRLTLTSGSFGGGTVQEGALTFAGNVDVGNLSVSNGAAVELQGGVSIDAGTLTLRGAGPTGAGALRNVNGTNTWVGPITLAADSTIGSTAGSLTVSRNINNGGFVLTVAGAGNATFGGTGVLSGAGGLTKVGAGTLTLSGTGVNAYTGATAVNAGALNVQKASALGPANGTGTIVANGATLQTQGGVTFNAEPLTLNGGGAGGNGALRNISGNNTWTGPITLGSASTIGSSAGTLTVNSNINNAGFTLTVNGAGTTVFGGAGVLSGAGGLTKAGTGTLRLEGAGVNTYAGATTVNAGVLNVRKASALGPANGTGTTVATGAALQLEGGVNFNSESLTLSGAGINATGALRNVSGNNVWNGATTLAANSTIGSSADTLTVNRNINNAGFLLTVNSAGSTVLTGVLSSTGGLTKVDRGTLRLEGAGANTYTGTTTVNAGTLVLAKAAGVAAMGSSQLTLGGSTVRLANEQQIPNATAVTVNAGGLLDLANLQETIGALSVTAGTVQTGTGRLTLGGNVTLSSANVGGSPRQALITGNLSLGGTSRTFTVNNGPHAVDALISAVIGSGSSQVPQFPAGLTKAGPGTLQLTANNTYNRTEITGGTLIIDGNHGGSSILNRGTIVHTGATLSGRGTVEPLTVEAGGTVSPGGSLVTLRVDGNLVFSDNSTFDAQVVPTNGVAPDQLAVAGTVTLNNATLRVLPLFMTAGTSPGATFRIIDNDGADAVAGTFEGLPENAQFAVQTQGVVNGQVVFQVQAYRITYRGGDGNDVVLTFLNSATMAPDLQISSDAINEGDEVTLTGRLLDPDPRDFLTLEIDWGDGSPIETFHPGTRPFRLAHRYGDDSQSQPNGQYVVKATWFDDEGAGNSREFRVTVNNVAPVVSLPGNKSKANTDKLFKRGGSFDDPGGDSWTATVNFGDGTGDQPLEFDAKGRFRLEHLFASPGTYSVTVTLVDDDGGEGSERFDVVVG